MSTTAASSAPNHQQQPQNSSSTGNQFYVPRNVIESVIQNLDGLISATSVAEVLEHRRQIAKLLRFEESGGIRNFFRLKGVLFTVKSLSKWNRVAAILKALDLKAAGKEYALRGKMAEKRILVIGGGISGLRAAIECLLIGAKVICVEKRDEFSRNNVIHLWPNVINDLYTFEGKRLYGQFCVGSIDHVSIRQLQLMLLKIAVILGVTFVPNIAFEEICPRIIEPKEAACSGPESCNCCCHVHGFGGGAYAHFSSPSSPSVARDLSRQSFDVIIGCDGRRNTFSRYFPRNNRRGKLAIGLTANYVNRRTEEEAHCPEISGISRIYNQKWFKDLQEETGIELENIVYYRDETHYFVMTATKGSLLRRGVLRADYGDSHQLLSNSNIDISLLMRYSKDAAEWSSKLRRLEFALNSSHKPDVALFDFTSMYSATNASCAKRIHLNCCSGEHGRKSSSATKYTLMLLCGDSLLEPFWPTGSGAGRGFLSALDAAWAVSLWYSNVRDEFTSSADLETMLNVISRREYVYRLLAQTSPENTTPKGFTLDPATRYKNLNLRDSKTLTEIKAQVRHLIIDRSDLDMKTYVSNYETKRARRATVGINPEDVLKASALTAVSAASSAAAYKQTYNLDENYNSSTENRDRLSPRSKPIYAVPLSPTLNHALPLNCDNSTSVAHNFEVIERRPKNPNADFELTSSSLYGALDQQTSNSGSSRPTSPRGDFRPRNEAQQLQQQKYYQKDEELQRKDYQARNHFILNANNEDSNLEKPSSFSGYHHHYQTENKENSFYAQHQQPNRNLPSDPQSRSSYYGGSASSQSQKSTAAQNRSSLHFPSSSSSALSSQFTDPTSKLYDFGNYDDHQLSEEESNRQAAREYGNSKQPYSWASRAAFLRDFAERNSRRHELSAMEQHQQAHQPQPRSPKNKPTGSSEIIEKAIYLEQKFEEQRKPYQPTLSKVGKIEDEDWNVKIWNSEEIFAPKPAERRNMVHDNSKALLQSRITQLHNNFTSSSAKDEILRGTGVGERNRSSDYVSMLSNEVASKFSGGNSGGSRSSRLTNSNNNCTTTASLKTSSAEPLASVQLLKANNASGGGGGGVDLTDSESSAAAFRRTTTTTAPSNLKTVELLLQPSGVECKRCSRPITAFDRVSVLGQNYHRTCLTCKVCSIMLRQDELLSEEFSCKLCRSSSRLHGFSSAAAASSSAPFSTPLTTSFSSAAVANIDSSNGNISSSNARSSFFDQPAPMSVSLIEAKKNFLVNIEQIDLRERAEFEIMDEGKDVDDVLAETTTTVNGQATDSSSSDAKVRGSPNKHQTTPDQDDNDEDHSEESDPNSSSSANHSDINYTDDEHSESDVAPVDDLEVSQKRSSQTKKEKEALNEKEEVVSLPAVLPEDESEFAALMKEPPLPLLRNGEEIEKEEEEDENEREEDANEVVVDEELCRSNYQEQQLEKSLDDDDGGSSPMIADHQIELSNGTDSSSSSSSSSVKDDNEGGNDDDSMLPPSELPPPPPAPAPDSSLPPDSLATTTTITSACFSSTSANTVNSSSVDSCSDSDGPPSPAPPLPPPSPSPPVDNHSSPPSSPPSPPPPQPPPQLPPPLMTQSFTTTTTANSTNNHRQPLQAPPPYRNPFESYTPSSALQQQQPFSSLVYPEPKNSPSAVRPAPLPPPPTSLPTSNRMFATLDYPHHRTSGSRGSSSTDSTAAPTLNWRSSLLSNSQKDSSLQEEESKSRRPHSGKLPVTSGAPIRDDNESGGDNELDPAALPPRYRYSGAFTEKFYRTLSQPTLYEQLQHIDRKLKSARAGPPSHEVPFADGGGNSGSKGANNPSNAPVASIEDV